ncbi:MAG: hypothetical protein EOO92_08010 [Pedobacter sp.]|nr:MAG: hypothetical protein EOO92_08010 [Pedobacter sp.]
MKRALYLLLIFLTVGFGCKKNRLDEDFFESPARQYDLAVEGGINTRFQTQSIRLTRPALHPDSLPKPISKASVVVNDGLVDIVYRENSTIPGLYQGTLRGEPNYNSAYKLTVKYEGKTYNAIDTLRQVVNIVDDFLPLSTRLTANNMIEVNIPKHTFGYLNPNKWYIVHETKDDKGVFTFPQWLPSRFDQSVDYSYTHFLGSPNSLYPLNNLKRNFTVGQDIRVHIYKISLSSRYAKYLYSVFMETDWSGLFSGVPVNVESNVSGNAQGFFSVVDVDYRIYPAKELY